MDACVCLEYPSISKAYYPLWCSGGAVYCRYVTAVALVCCVSMISSCREAAGGGGYQCQGVDRESTRLHFPCCRYAITDSINGLKRLLGADFKSVELRVLAHLSADTQLLSAFNSPHSTDIFVNLTSEWSAPVLSIVPWLNGVCVCVLAGWGSRSRQ